MPPTVHSMPKKKKPSFDLGDAALQAYDEDGHSSSPKRTSRTAPSLKSPKSNIQQTSRATKRQCKPWNISPPQRPETDPSVARIIDWIDAQSALTSQPFSSVPDDLSVECNADRPSIEEKSLRVTSASLLSNDSTESEMSQSCISSQSDRSAVVKPTDPDFETLLEDRGIYALSRNAPEPTNITEVRGALGSTRKSPGPSDDSAENFPRRVRKSVNEGGAMQALLSAILLRFPVSMLCRNGDLLFTPSIRRAVPWVLRNGAMGPPPAAATKDLF
ncbi:hypothetical protein ABEF95_004312 [Exophiala dermatitidis]